MVAPPLPLSPAPPALPPSDAPARIENASLLPVGAPRGMTDAHSRNTVVLSRCWGHLHRLISPCMEEIIAYCPACLPDTHLVSFSYSATQKVLRRRRGIGSALTRAVTSTISPPAGDSAYLSLIGQSALSLRLARTHAYLASPGSREHEGKADGSGVAMFGNVCWHPSSLSEKKRSMTS